MRPHSFPRAVLLAAALTTTALCALFALFTLDASEASAHGGSVDVPAPPTPKAPPGDGATAESLLKQLDGLDAKAAAALTEPIKQARKALERAHGARQAGDTAHARMLDALALEWAQTAETLSRAARSEEAATTGQRKARDTGTALERGRTLLEETQARKGRAEAELARAEAEAKQAADAAQVAEDARLAGSKKGKDARGKDAAQPAPRPKSPPGKTPAKKGGK